MLGQHKRFLILAFIKGSLSSISEHFHVDLEIEWTINMSRDIINTEDWQL